MGFSSGFKGLNEHEYDAVQGCDAF